jgi:hypothetical protein
MALASGCSVAQAARKFSLSVDAVRRHKRNHLPPELIRKARSRQLLGEQKYNLEELRRHESENLLARLVRQRLDLLKLIGAMETNDPRGAVRGHHTLLANLELEGKLLGELGQHATTNIQQNLVIAPEYPKLRQLLLSALKPYPAARQAVLAALRSVESATDLDSPKQIDGPTIGTDDSPEHPTRSGTALGDVAVPSVGLSTATPAEIEEGFAWSELGTTSEADPQTTASVIIRA